MRSLLHRVFAIIPILTVCLTLTCHADGIVIFKSKSYQADNYAKVASYKSIKNYQATTIFYLNNGKTLEFNNYIWRKVVPFTPTESFDITEAYVIDKLRNSKKEYTSALQQFPQAKDLLNSEIGKIDDILNNWNKGYIRINNKWITKSEYELQIARAEKQKAAQQAAAISEMERMEKHAAQEKLNSLTQQIDELEQKKKAIVLDLKNLADKLAVTEAKLDAKLESMEPASGESAE